MVEVEVCRQTGMLPTPYCGEIHEEVFLSENTPKVVDNIFLPFRVHTPVRPARGPQRAGIAIGGESVHGRTGRGERVGRGGRNG